MTENSDPVRWTRCATPAALSASDTIVLISCAEALTRSYTL